MKLKERVLMRKIRNEVLIKHEREMQERFFNALDKYFDERGTPEKLRSYRFNNEEYNNHLNSENLKSNETENQRTNTYLEESSENNKKIEINQQDKIEKSTQIIKKK